MTTMRSLAILPAGADLAELLWLGDERAANPAVTGGKAANLSRLSAVHDVPPGFVLTVPGATLPRELRRVLAAAYRRLGELVGTEDPPVAVRSSAVDEDGLQASFAGQHDTFLNVSGADAIWWAVARCFASFGAQRALDYRRDHGLPEAPERVAVLVQWLVPADASGVVFSADPVSGARDEVVINASWGLGESIVGGAVTPDTWRVAHDGLAIRGRVVADKRRMTIASPGGAREVPVPGRMSRLPALDDAQVRRAAALAVALERRMGWPVDLELAWAGDDLFLLQCRPVTTLHHDRSPR
jgi:phosphoenolpyruvate synthase/pyruvate phosphate dikinase